MTSVLEGVLVRLRDAVDADVERLVAIRSTPEVRQRWGGDDLTTEVAEDLDDDELHVMAVEFEGEVVGAVQWSAEDDPMYHYASIDVFLDPVMHRRGLGTDAVRTLARHLIEERGYHRLSIDPAADNTPAITAYTKVGFKPVGILRCYERGPDGDWHDGLLMDLLAEELVT